jgi:hypothetical protein
MPRLRCAVGSAYSLESEVPKHTSRRSPQCGCGEKRNGMEKLTREMACIFTRTINQLTLTCMHAVIVLPSYLVGLQHTYQQTARPRSAHVKQTPRRHSRPPHGCTFCLGLDSTHRSGSFVRSRHPCRPSSYRSVNKRSGREKCTCPYTTGTVVN